MAKYATWRWVYYLNIILDGLALIAVVFLYHPVRYWPTANMVIFGAKDVTAFSEQRDIKVAAYQMCRLDWYQCLNCTLSSFVEL
jgi:hypothetical protein